MSKCWYCNNELTSGDSPKHFGICNKCYDEMFKSGDTIIRSFTNKIADLEAKLEESEKEHELLKEQLQEQIDYKDEYYHYWQETKKELAKENEILNVALDLACQTLYDINFKLYNTEMDFKEYFKQQALTQQHEDKGE